MFFYSHPFSAGEFLESPNAPKEDAYYYLNSEHISSENIVQKSES